MNGHSQTLKMWVKQPENLHMQMLCHKYYATTIMIHAHVVGMCMCTCVVLYLHTESEQSGLRTRRNAPRSFPNYLVCCLRFIRIKYGATPKLEWALAGIVPCTLKTAKGLCCVCVIAKVKMGKRQHQKDKMYVDS